MRLWRENIERTKGQGQYFNTLGNFSVYLVDCRQGAWEGDTEGTVRIVWGQPERSCVMKANEISFTEKVISSIKYREDQQNKCLEGVDCFSKSVTFKEQFQRNGSEGKR